MILASSVYTLILDKIRKDVRGLSLSPDEYNNLCPVINERLYDTYYKEFEEGTESSDTLGWFKSFNESIALTGGVGVFPHDYYHLIGKPRIDDNGTTRWVDLVTTFEHAEREEDFLTKATVTHPTCQIGGEHASGYTQVRVTPTTIATLYIDFLRIADTPFLDYYVNNTTLAYTYMATGVNVSVPAGSTYRTGTAGGGAPIASQTINWEWAESDLPLIIAMFLEEIGVTLPDEVLYAGGQASETKILSDDKTRTA